MSTTEKSSPKKILITGANGFVARHLVPQLIDAGYLVRLTTRDENSLHRARELYPTINDIVVVGDLPQADWSNVVDGIDCIIHLAARVHMMHETSGNHDAIYRSANCDATLNLGNAAIKSNVRRFIYISSIKVNGEFTIPGQAFSQRDLPNPADPYAQSKWQAEQKLRELAKSSPLELVIFRPPLIFGPGVRANFLRLIQLVKRRIPLPLAGISNERSLLYVENFAAALTKSIVAKNVVGNTYTIADQPALSTANLIHEIAKACDIKPRLLSLPLPVLTLIGKITRQSAIIDRLTQSLLVDPHQLYRDLDWEPPVSMTEAIRRTVSM